MTAWVPAARLLAQIGVPYPYLNYIGCASSSILTEIKVEVTDRCNLACSFCHQEFGAKGGTTALDMAAFERLLAAAKKDRIRVIRLTGGEPMVLKSIDAYIKRAKAEGFFVVVNTNGTALTEKRFAVLKDYIDCVKISLPAPDEETTTRLTGDAKAWRRKWTAIELLARHNVMTHILSVMTPENIRHFEDFLLLLEPYPHVSWKPLRDEPQEGGAHPVSREDMRVLAKKIAAAQHNPRWKTVMLGLGAPFCALENPAEAAAVFGGGHSCGPYESLTVTSEGNAVRCYSRREPLDLSRGLRAAARDLTVRDFEAMPAVCRACPHAVPCRAGCRCEAALVETPYGRLDYLADPSVMPGAEAFRTAP